MVKRDIDSRHRNLVAQGQAHRLHPIREDPQAGFETFDAFRKHIPTRCIAETVWEKDLEEDE